MEVNINETPEEVEEIEETETEETWQATVNAAIGEIAGLLREMKQQFQSLKDLSEANQRSLMEANTRLTETIAAQATTFSEQMASLTRQALEPEPIPAETPAETPAESVVNIEDVPAPEPVPVEETRRRRTL